MWLAEKVHPFAPLQPELQKSIPCFSDWLQTLQLVFLRFRYCFSFFTGSHRDTVAPQTAGSNSKKEMLKLPIGGVNSFGFSQFYGYLPSVGDW